MSETLDGDVKCGVGDVKPLVTPLHGYTVLVHVSVARVATFATYLVPVCNVHGLCVQSRCSCKCGKYCFVCLLFLVPIPNYSSVNTLFLSSSLPSSFYSPLLILLPVCSTQIERERDQSTHSLQSVCKLLNYTHVCTVYRVHVCTML